MFTQALQLNQLPIQWAPGDLSLEVKQLEWKLNTHLRREQRLNMSTAIPPPPHVPSRHAKSVLPFFYTLHQNRYPMKAPFLNQIHCILPKQFIGLNKIGNVYTL
jgi:hypothetical protein